MRWTGGRESDNVEDRRGQGGGLAIGGGIGTMVLIVVYLLLGGNPNEVINQVVQPAATEQRSTRSPEEEKLARFTKVVLGYTEQVWDSVFRADGKNYEAPKLVLFTGQTQSGCGFASAADQKVYIDLSFFQELAERFKAPGEMAMAYVVAHEVGHHIQQIWGISSKVQEMKASLSET
ncbi:MAG: metalloprotease, partial [Sphingobacteriia bacterium]